MSNVDLQSLIDEIAHEMARAPDRGRVATYIPSLASVPIERFGITILDHDGNCYSAGDADVPFSVQSTGKVFTLTMALDAVGDVLWERVGREPSGSPFNSIVQLESERGIPRNPFINSGAIVVADVLLEVYKSKSFLDEFLNFMKRVSGDDGIYIDEEVAISERQTGFRNWALGNYMRAFENINHPIKETLGTYFHVCALAMSCRQLAHAGRFLMCGGHHHAGTEDTVISAQRTRRILAMMMMCGHYDGSGEFAYRVGLPGKSGVGGGILAIVPGVASITVWSPGLNEHGNSKLGMIALEKLVDRTGWSVFRADR